MPKEGAVGKKARVGAFRPFQAIHAPLKRKNQKTVRQDNEEASRRGEQVIQQLVSNAVNSLTSATTCQTNSAFKCNRNTRTRYIIIKITTII